MRSVLLLCHAKKKKEILKSVASTPCPDSKGVATSQSADCICVGGTFEEVG